MMGKVGSIGACKNGYVERLINPEDERSLASLRDDDPGIRFLPLVEMTVEVKMTMDIETTTRVLLSRISVPNCVVIPKRVDLVRLCL
uniref:Uncharacterized protein n=1 Tax=Candidatus Kentrum sp. MB TaxID=2138164 RepID=A0A451BDC8_9GAMM|nr:MAG: hypothetical protein BECKMB1821G_GA0114241_10494 [Candidatus Kentron sp. MB]VFK33671.1 MAG: hypothetical protein BECKMB1821I_GA0114274_10514 [Candidatus Kentron sp. MB]VFK76289.1 MAG: hypothetical protein BECKMB1821H_GA0114242_10504 [Candidatus Kentron sp. MB]